MRWNHGNAFHYGLSILNGQKMYGNLCGNPYGNTLHYGLSMFIEFSNVW